MFSSSFLSDSLSWLVHLGWSWKDEKENSYALLYIWRLMKYDFKKFRKHSLFHLQSGNKRSLLIIKEIIR